MSEEEFNDYMEDIDTIIDNYKKENEKLHSIIKEVREYIKENYIYVDGEGYSKEEEDYYVRKNKLLEILDKENI